ncbi:hypothetical protein AMATHDRAFT_88803 [Amanita thiersii Skay4041]|uniref:Uncharacterized protein n=1 Tax=Amanita thiersii Skay4041 TaxID=703135 RepID=A0A2A9NB34_9AGAR|nr:hypothetical protein AMATHDRAFT_88803 [Amanita thiersii Skay4041]
MQPAPPPPPSPTKPTKPTNSNPTSRPPTPSPTTTTYSFPPASPHSEALKPNPHPYPIKTTSTGVLSRSNSSSGAAYQYQYYVPASPTKAQHHAHRFHHRHNNSDGGGAAQERGGRRHRYSKSLNSTLPTPLPGPPSSALFAMDSSGSSRSVSPASSRSASSSRSVSPSKLATRHSDTFGAIVEPGNQLGSASRMSRRTRAETMPPSTASAFSTSLSAHNQDEGDEGEGQIRGRSGKIAAVATHTGGKVRGMVASFERSASLSGDNDSEDGYGYDGRSRRRTGSTSSIGYASAKDGHHSSNRRESGWSMTSEDGSISIVSSPTASWASPLSQLRTVESSPYQPPYELSTAIFHDVQPFPTTSSSNTSTPNKTPKRYDPNRSGPPSSFFEDTPYEVDTIKGKSLDTLPIPPATHQHHQLALSTGENTIKSRSSPPAAELSFPPTTKTQQTRNEAEEPTMDQLLASLDSPQSPSQVYNLNSSIGAEAWERDVGSTVKRVVVESLDKAGSERMMGGVVYKEGSGRVKGGFGTGSKVMKMKMKMVDLFGDGGTLAGDDDMMTMTTETKEEQYARHEVETQTDAMVDCGSLPPLATPGPEDTTTDLDTILAAREGELVREIGEAREMARELGQRVAGVEERVGEMEKDAKELRKEASVGGGGVEVEVEAKKGGRVEKGVQVDGTLEGGEAEVEDPRTLAKKLVVSITKSIVGYVAPSTSAPSSPSTTALTQHQQPLPRRPASLRVAACACVARLLGLSGSSGVGGVSVASRDAMVGVGGSVKRGWARTWSGWVLVFGLGACAFVVRAVVRRVWRITGGVGGRVGVRGE